MFHHSNVQNMNIIIVDFYYKILLEGNYYRKLFFSIKKDINITLTKKCNKKIRL